MTIEKLGYDMFATHIHNQVMPSDVIIFFAS